MMQMKLNDAWAEACRRVGSKLSELYSAGGKELPQARLFEAMDYSLLAGGKRLRPFLVYLFCCLLGGDMAQADHAAMAIEMIHTYSLIHDDLPAMDNDDYRRGRLTNHKVYGEALAILAGDGLLTDAFRVLSLAPLPPERVAAALRLLSVCAGPYGMAGGQVLDMEADTRTCTEEEVLQIHDRKTGALIRAACCLGVLCANGDKKAYSAAEEYAKALGLAFQYRDDILDVIGDAAKLGKAVGVDEKKNTFVRLYGVEKCQSMVLEETEKAKAALHGFAGSDLLCALADQLANRDH